ncbi:hypothetical protein [Winogradskyella sp. A2]|uniref:hypothetical protein n=1 Tax=Winogradskyella sp. A2 TaxID=3366944 RepID=UPI00398C52E0
MSENLPQNSQNEEVDLGQLFNAIGRLFEKLFSFIGKTLKGIFKALIYTLKPIVNNFKIITIILFTAAILGFITEKFSDPTYVSDMLVRPYFDSKYQLANNVDYFNALIDAENFQELSQIFEIDTINASHLQGFEMEIGPETENDLLQQYDNYIKTIDSTLASDVTYEEFIDNRDILAASIFSIKATSSTHDIFPSLEQGFVKTFENDYSKKLKRIRDSTVLIRKSYHQIELRRVDSLQKVYLNILEKESDKDQLSLSEGGLFPITQERSITREYELFQEELKVRSAIRSLDERLIEESDFYDILSGFEEVGTEDTDIYKKYSIIFPLTVFALMIITFLLFRTFHFIKKYE